MRALIGLIWLSVLLIAPMVAAIATAHRERLDEREWQVLRERAHRYERDGDY